MSDILNELTKERWMQNPSGWNDALCRKILKQMLEVSWKKQMSEPFEFVSNIWSIPKWIQYDKQKKKTSRMNLNISTVIIILTYWFQWWKYHQHIALSPTTLHNNNPVQGHKGSEAYLRNTGSEVGIESPIHLLACFWEVEGNHWTWRKPQQTREDMKTST